jgi:hypothetical protein
MQTFLPYPDFYKSARVLDSKRLGKQRVEAYQILRTLSGETNGWKNHPATRMWRGHEPVLFIYTLIVCDEWVKRNNKDTIISKLERYRFPENCTSMHPPWLGNEDFHRSHRANLVRKAPEIYVPIFGCLPPEPYVWPV